VIGNTKIRESVYRLTHRLDTSDTGSLTMSILRESVSILRTLL